MRGIPIIQPKEDFVFVQKQGSLFKPESYQYKSSDGLMIRSLDECFYHRYLAYYGIAHTYEPDLLEGHRIYKRPDFGVANNFLFELCRTKEAALNREEDFREDGEYKSDGWYKVNMSNKRQKYLDHGFNIVELHEHQVLINGHDASEKHVLLIIAKYNNHFRVAPKRNIYFCRLKGYGRRIKPKFCYSDAETPDISKVVEHYQKDWVYIK